MFWTASPCSDDSSGSSKKARPGGRASFNAFGKAETVHHGFVATFGALATSRKLSTSDSSIIFSKRSAIALLRFF